MKIMKASCKSRRLCCHSYFNNNFVGIFQCCGSGTGIRCVFDPGIGMGKKSGSGIQIRDKHPGSYFTELGNNFFG
jgi:hypothetical protein